MRASPNIDLERLSGVVVETVAWCASQQLRGTFDEPEGIRQRQMLLRQADEWRVRAYLKQERFWNRLLRRDYRETREWHTHTELLRQAAAISISMPLADQCRSPALDPKTPVGEIQNDNNRRDLVSSVIVRRSGLLRLRGQEMPAGAGSSNLFGGRILIYVPEDNVADGASEYVSGGFFDVYDTPPWDLWIGYANHSLLCWVPPQLLELANKGVDVNPVACIRWLD